MKKQEIIDKIESLPPKISAKTYFLDLKEWFLVPNTCIIKTYDYVWCRSCFQFEAVVHGRVDNDFLDKHVKDRTVYRNRLLYEAE